MHHRIPELAEELEELLTMEDSWQLHADIDRRHKALAKLLFDEEVDWDEPDCEGWAEYRDLDERIQTRLKVLEALKPKPTPRKPSPIKERQHPAKITLIDDADPQEFAGKLLGARSTLSLQRSKTDNRVIITTIAGVLPYLLLEPDVVKAMDDTPSPKTYNNVARAKQLYEKWHIIAKQAYESRERDNWLDLARVIAAEEVNPWDNSEEQE